MMGFSRLILMTGYLLIGLIGSDAQVQGTSSSKGTPSSIRLILAEINQQRLQSFQQVPTQQDLITKLEQEGYHIIREGDIVYAMPVAYFRDFDRFMQISKELDLFNTYEKEQLSESTQVLIEETIKKYRNEYTYDKIYISAAIIFIFEDESVMYQATIFPPMLDKRAFSTFFSGNVEQWQIVSNVNSGTGPKTLENLPQGIRADIANMLRLNQTNDQADVSKISKNINKNSNIYVTNILCSYLSPSFPMSEGEVAGYRARYYQLLQREIENRQAQCEALWRRVIHPFLGQREEWHGWRGHVWKGRWSELPIDIRQKITFSLQTKGIAISNLQNSQCQLTVIPYVGVVRAGEIGISSEWFPLIYK